MDIIPKFEPQLLPVDISRMTQDDFKVFGATQQTGDIDILLEWYWGTRLLPALKPLWYLPHPNKFILGSYGSGKTTNMAEMAFASLISNTNFKFVNLAPVGRQAKLMYYKFMEYYRDNDRLAHLIVNTREAPYPEIHFWNGSQAEFVTAKPEYIEHIMGNEFDHINLDEAALTPGLAQAIGNLRTRLRGVRPRINIHRQGLLSVTTVPGVDADLRSRYELGLQDNPDYLSVKITARHNPYVTDEDLRLMIQELPPSDVPTYIDCEWPDVSGRQIPARFYDACEDPMLNVEMDTMLQEKVQGANMVEVDRVGVIKWEWPFTQGHYYLTVGDPGTGDPPRRNAGVVLAWDVTTKPPMLVYFDWIYGGGSISPWVSSFKYAKSKYPGLGATDSTSTQKYMNELIWDREGIIVHPLNFSRDKWGLLNAAKMLWEYGGWRYPVIEGMKRQARAYDLPDDKLDQDIIATMMMSAWMIRPNVTIHEDPPQDTPYIWASRGSRAKRTPMRRVR